MGLERWDPSRGKWIMYSAQEEHSQDCRDYPFEAIPQKVFLDTNVVNLMVKHQKYVFEQRWIAETLPQALAHDIEAMMHLMVIGFRANWHMVVSAKTIEEIERTSDPLVRRDLLSYAWEVVNLPSECTAFAAKPGFCLGDADCLLALPDVDDRVLVGNAIGLGCDVFCTRDIRTIVKKRHKLTELPIRVMTPVEWWRHVKPWGGLWA